MVQFDAAMNKALEKEVTTKATFKGHLDSYRFCDQVSCKGLQHLRAPCLAICEAMDKAMVNRWQSILATSEGYWDSTNSCAVWLISILRALQAVSDCCLHLKHSNS